MSHYKLGRKSVQYQNAECICQTEQEHSKKFVLLPFITPAQGPSS